MNPDTGGIVLIATTYDSVLDNRLSGNNLGIDAESSTTASVIAGNEVRGGGDGIGLLDSDGNSLARNNVHDLPGSGIILDDFGGDGSDSNTVADNSVARTGSDGCFVGAGSAGNHLQGNLSTRGDANGFLVTTAGNRLSSNTASYNHLRGIDAIAGTVDGGGNRAFGNGLSPQCVGVSCA